MDKTALITGGNSGIGYATAELMKEKGYTVFISGRNPEKLKKASASLGVEAIVADMSDPKAIQSLASHFLETGLDVLVSNAAIAKFMPISELTEESFSEVFNVNVRGPLMLIKHLLPALEKQNGCITAVSSVVANIGVPTVWLYAATKGAIDAFTRSLAVELAPKKIRVNAVAPGSINTPFFYNNRGMTQEEVAKSEERYSNSIPLGRFGNPEEVAQVIISQVESTYVTGSVWVVDGGIAVR